MGNPKGSAHKTNFRIVLLSDKGMSEATSRMPARSSPTVKVQRAGFGGTSSRPEAIETAKAEATDWVLLNQIASSRSAFNCAEQVCRENAKAFDDRASAAGVQGDTQPNSEEAALAAGPVALASALLAFVACAIETLSARRPKG